MQKTIRSRDGFVSLVVAGMIMIILSLITIGFTRLMQREQQQAIDRQLTRQALYAAESGINDVYRQLKATPSLAAEKLDCDTSLAPSVNGGDISGDGAVAYTCVLYDKTPVNLEYSLGTNGAKVVLLKTESGNPFDTLTVRWGNELGNNFVDTALPDCGAAANTFPASRSNTVPILRFDLTNIATLTRDALIDGTDYLYLVPCDSPTASPATHNYLTGQRGTIVQVPCLDGGAAQPCVLSITGLGSSSFSGRLSALYDSGAVTISATEISGGSASAVEFVDSQYSIDVTARAGDVVRRLRASIPINGADDAPVAGFQAFDGVCKLLAVDVTTASITDGCGFFTAPIPPGVVCPTGVRFPGDPCPAYTGRAYWGSSYAANGDPSARHETPTRSLSIRRTYWQWDDATNAGSDMYRTIRNDILNNRLPLVSFKPPLNGTGVSTWDEIARGDYDADLRRIVDNLKNASQYGPVWVVLHHEPEGGGADGNNPDDNGDPAAWRGMQSRFRQTLNSRGSGNIAFMPILMTYTWNPVSNRDPEDWWVSGIWDAYLVDHFHDEIPGGVIDSQWNNFIGWIEAKGLPFGTAEWGNRGTDAQAAQEMQEFWDWRLIGGGAAPYKDMLAYAYYDSYLNSTNGSWELTGQPLNKFHDILRNDPNVIRICDLGFCGP